MSKLSDVQVKVLESVNTTGQLPKGTRQTTLTKLRDELGYVIFTNDGGQETQYSLTTEGRKAIGVEDNPHAAIEAEVEEEYTDHPMVTESVEAPVFKLTRRMVREARRNVARYNRRLMRLQGKRARKYGVENVIIRHIAA